MQGIPRERKIKKEAQPLGSKKRRRPRLRWTVELHEGARMFGMRNWWMIARDRDEGKWFHEEHSKISCGVDDNEYVF